MSDHLPEIAPRNKAFAISRMTHVVDSPALPVKHVVGLARFALRRKAEQAAAEIDWRLNPTIIIVDEEQRP